ncbi:MAG: hypothetical protein OER82_07855 [Nitrosopumilus sp.]|nr:hypothetical protein [Nitrosopumilus sp.]
MANKNLQKEIVSHPFFYKDGLTIPNNHPTKWDEKNNLSDSSEKANSKDRYQNLESICKIDGVNQKIITQLEEENQSLFQMTKLQQQRIERLEEQLYEISGDRLFL